MKTKNPPSRRRQRRGRQKQPTTNPTTAAQVRKIIAEELVKGHQRVDIDMAGVNYAELVVDPFGQGDKRGPKCVRSRIPDGHSQAMVHLCLTSKTSFSGATATNGAIVVWPVNTTSMGGLEIGYGNSAEDPTHSPTGHATQLNAEDTLALAILADHSGEFRLIQSGIRVTAISAPDDTSGTLEGFFSQYSVRSAVATYNTYANIFEEGGIGLIQSVAEGITVRGPVDATFRHVNTAGAVYTQPTSYNYRQPVVRFVGLSAGTTLLVESVMHIEVAIDAGSAPFPVRTPAPYEPELEHLIHYLNEQPFVVTGNSFASFFKGIWKGIKKVFRIGSKVVGYGVSAAKTAIKGAQVVGSLF